MLSVHVPIFPSKNKCTAKFDASVDWNLLSLVNWDEWRKEEE